MKNCILFFAFCLFSYCSNCQELPIARNSKYTGEGMVIHKGKKCKIEKDQMYYQGDVIELTKPELVLLLGGSGKDRKVSIIKPGKYKVSDLYNSQDSKELSLSFRYFMDILHHTVGDHVEKLPESVIGANYGAPTRGLGCDSLISPRNNLHTDATTIRFSWKKMDGVSKYNFRIMEFSSRKEVVYEINVNDTSFVLNTSSFQWENKEKYIWSIEPKDAERECEPTYNSFALYTHESAKEEKESIIKDISKEDGDLIYQLKIMDAFGKEGWETE